MGDNAMTSFALHLVWFVKKALESGTLVAPLWRPLAPLLSRRPEAVPAFASRSYATVSHQDLCHCWIAHYYGCAISKIVNNV